MAPTRIATISSCHSRAAIGSSSRSNRSGGSAATPAGNARRLSKLGGTEWLRAKQRVRKAVDDLAEELLALYASRADARGHAFGPDSPWQAEMEASFPYEETIDQLRASAEVKADMELVRPMDRLVVGDVGYGKTEVALRAAFKAAQDGVQVAVLVPTTVLAAQHEVTFSQRFAAFPLEVRLLSRFVAPAAQAATIAGLADGSVDIVIGTHRLLSKDVRFRDLGLVVVDEEQRFGVAAKERLKQLKREVDVLTLSATPIPRTLNLALAGIRDLSVIETPPEDRLPIQTRVAEASAGLVRDAILRELDRGGQVFYVHNRVETIEAQAEQLRRMLPGARFVVGHGQMAEGALEKVMIAFADGAADVLVSTTIIESGLDIPNANTIIIDRADTLGLAQLYQLRGRVGRSSRRAYAYLLYRRRERLSDEARKRLQAIFNASELGAGFQIALSDLEIRGAGNILGGEQSGHMAAVGFDLYSRLLAEAVESRKATLEGRAPIVEAPQAVVDLPIEAHLPTDYVPDEAQKLELYRRLARARSAGDLAAFRQEVLDRYGPMPDPVIRLIEVAQLRLTAEAAGVASISREEGWLVVRFGARLTRATAMRLLEGPSLPGVRPSDITFASNQVRIRLPKDVARGWTLTHAVVDRLTAVSPSAIGIAMSRRRPLTRAGQHGIQRLPPSVSSTTGPHTPRRCPMRSYLVVGNQTLAGPELAAAIAERIAAGASAVPCGGARDSGRRRADVGRGRSPSGGAGTPRCHRRPDPWPRRRGVRRGRSSGPGRGGARRHPAPPGRRSHPLDAAGGDLALAGSGCSVASQERGPGPRGGRDRPARAGRDRGPLRTSPPNRRSGGREA